MRDDSTIEPQGSTQYTWRVRLFNGPILEDANGREIRRFRSRKVGALLAYLALHLGDACPRETLYEALWPEDDDADAVANRLRVVLSSLRRQLEPPGALFGSVLDVGEPGRVRLRADAVWCDYTNFERLFRAGRSAEAGRLARGPLLPGYYEEWAVAAQADFELLREEIPAAAPASAMPPPRAADVVPPPLSRRLPLYLTRFFGRDAERGRLLDLLAENRLVTVTGTGGIGKTRLAAETARQAPHSCVFVPLAELADPAQLPETALRALSVVCPADLNPLDLLIEILVSRSPLLLILDNAEHLAAAVADVALRLLEAAPDLRMLVTSRQRLDIPGEALMSLQPLEPPPYVSTPERVMEFPAIALFLDRAKNARPDFVLTARHVDAVVEICRRLEGLPLALELAAARITAQSPAQIAAALSSSIIDLKSRQRGLSERHRSLRAAIQTGFDLLPKAWKRFFACLSVFQSHWTAEAARAVTQVPDAESLLEELVVRSLVVVKEEAGGGALGYAFLETLRQFAAEQLSETERRNCARRHAEYYLGLAARVREDDVRTLDPLDPAQDNLRLALEWGGKHRDDLFWQGLTGALTYAFVRGLHRTAVHWIDDTAPSISDLPDPVMRFNLRYAACLILPDIGRTDETEQIARAMNEDAAANDRPVWAAFAAVIQGYAANTRGDLATAVRIHREVLVRARSLNDRSLLQSCLSHASGTLHDYGAQLGGETEAGSAVLEESVGLAGELYALVPPYSRRVPLSALLLGSTLLHQNRIEEGYHYIKETQRAGILMGATTEMMYSFIYESQVADSLGYTEYATLRYGAFLALQERMGYSMARAQAVRPAWIRLHDDLKEILGTERFATLLQHGKQTSIDVFAAESLPWEAFRPEPPGAGMDVRKRNAPSP